MKHALFITFVFIFSCAKAPLKQDKSRKVQVFSKVIGWPEGKTPNAPVGLEVVKFADGFRNPRHTYILPNGDVLVVESESKFKSEAHKKEVIENGRINSDNMGSPANRITLLRDRDGDGKAEFRSTFLKDLNQPFGMLLIGNRFYVANTDGLIRFTYMKDETELRGKGEKIMDLPAGGYNNHWTRNLLLSKDGKIFVSVGSSSNVGENGMEEEKWRANILVVDPDGENARVFASGLRNPVGMALQPETLELWTAVNERDELGDELVADYLTSVKDGGFYGWPYSYWGQNVDPRRKGEMPDLVEKAIVPDVSLGAHTASLGLTFMKSAGLGKKYKNGAFIGQHGSWNRSKLSGYKVVFVPFKNGRPSGDPEDFLTGFRVEGSATEVHGRPVGVTETPKGDLLVCDDSSNTVWLVRKKVTTSYRKTDTGFIMVLSEGDDVLGSIEALAEKESIGGATFTGMGFIEATFGFFNSKNKEYEPKEFPPMELASLTGTIARENGKPSLHAHGLVSGKDFSAHGGHLLKGTVGKGTLEVTVFTHGTELVRKEDPKLGAKAIEL